MADIDIKAGLGRTTSTGPGALQLPDVQVERREPVDVGTALQQLRGLRGYGGYGGGRSEMGNPTLINGGLRGGMPRSRGPRNSYSNVGGFGNASMGQPSGGSGTPAGKVAKYVKIMPGFGGFGGYIQSTAGEPGSIFAGYMDEGGPSNVNVIGGGGPSPVSQYSPQSQASSQLAALQQTMQQNQPRQRADWYGLGGRG